MYNNIFIFCRAIRTGKTTELQDWLKDKDAAGIVTPDENGKRIWINIATGEKFKMELAENETEEKVTVGKFSFSKAGFDKAQAIIANTDAAWLVIDEAGKLEVERDTGLEPALSAAIKKFKNNTGRGRLLLIVRDTLLEKATEKYGLAGATVIHSLKELC